MSFTPASVQVFRLPEMLCMIGRFRCPDWRYYNRGEILQIGDLAEVLALRTVSKSFLEHFIPPFPRTAISISSVEQLIRLFRDVIAYEKHWCRCSLSGGQNKLLHVNFLNAYLLEVEVEYEIQNNLSLWELAVEATSYMTNWTELNVIVNDEAFASVVARFGHWWPVGRCPIKTLRLKDTCSYGAGTQGVAHLTGSSPWFDHFWFRYTLEPYRNLQTLLVDTPAFPYPIPHDIDLEAFENAVELAAFLSTYIFSPHEAEAYAWAIGVLPNLRRYYLQYLHWDALPLSWEDPAGGVGRGRTFYVFRAPDGHLTTGQNVLDHYDGQVHDLEPFSLHVGPYQPDPSWADSQPSYEAPVCIYAQSRTS
ncbi:hypothetical protein BV20DRAFT_941197 [Pilatotrama ljubarskyi]|nr:hypothetical protein BV20DRAFT_941197 [Pilatotrama ljubarskyi]